MFSVCHKTENGKCDIFPTINTPLKSFSQFDSLSPVVSQRALCGRRPGPYPAPVLRPLSLLRLIDLFLFLRLYPPSYGRGEWQHGREGRVGAVVCLQLRVSVQRRRRVVFGKYGSLAVGEALQVRASISFFLPIYVYFFLVGRILF